MKSAINALEMTLETMENNEPINRKEGKHDQADLEAKTATEIRQALHILRAVEELTSANVRHEPRGERVPN